MLWKVINAADYGLPQQRMRVFVVATRTDLDLSYSFPPPTHSRSALVADMLSGGYWERHRIRPRSEFLQLETGKSTLDIGPTKPWKTERDLLAEIPTPSEDGDSLLEDHRIVPGAKAYPGHEGSDLDWPSKTVKAGVHGVPGGENTLRLPGGGVRYFTLRETAFLQGFPAGYKFCGSRIHVTRQIGNAVPPELAFSIGLPLAEALGRLPEKTHSKTVDRRAQHGYHR